MKRIILSSVCALIFLALGCQKGPYPYISKQDVAKIDSLVHPAIKNAAFIYKGNIYFVPDFDKPVVQITKDPSAAKFVKMSHDHSKFAYQDVLNRIVVIDNKGNTINTLSQYTQVKSFDWSADDKTLYILNGNAMAYYGPSLNLPAFTYPNIVSGSDEEIMSASVSLQGDFAYIAHGYNFFDGDKYELVVIPHTGGQPIVYTNPEQNVNTMDYVSFSANKLDMILGYKESDSGSDFQQDIQVFTDLKAYPDFTFGGTVCTPLYNSDLKYIVGGYVNTNDHLLEPSALYLGESAVFTGENVAQDKFLTSYSLSSANLYMDWK